MSPRPASQETAPRYRIGKQLLEQQVINWPCFGLSCIYFDTCPRLNTSTATLLALPLLLQPYSHLLKLSCPSWPNTLPRWLLSCLFQASSSAQLSRGEQGGSQENTVPTPARPTGKVPGHSLSCSQGSALCSGCPLQTPPGAALISKVRQALCHRAWGTRA